MPRKNSLTGLKELNRLKALVLYYRIGGGENKRIPTFSCFLVRLYANQTTFFYSHMRTVRIAHKDG